jgi:hypothetical protein
METNNKALMLPGGGGEKSADLKAALRASCEEAFTTETTVDSLYFASKVKWNTFNSEPPDVSSETVGRRVGVLFCCHDYPPGGLFVSYTDKLLFRVC